MSKISRTRKDQLTAKIAKYDELAESVRQLQARAQDYRTAIAGAERRKRNHRLIIEGVALEKYAGGPLSRQDIHDLVSVAISAGWNHPVPTGQAQDEE